MEGRPLIDIFKSKLCFLKVFMPGIEKSKQQVDVEKSNHGFMFYPASRSSLTSFMVTLTSESRRGNRRMPFRVFFFSLFIKRIGDRNTFVVLTGVQIL